MNDIKKNIRRIFWLFFALFLGLVLYLGHFVIFESSTTVNTVLNPRINIARDNVRRGNIYDRNGEILAESINQNGVYRRNYPHGLLFSHIIGSNDISKSGIEEQFNFDLLSLEFEVIQRFNNLVNDRNLEANSVHLTLDLELQQVAARALGNTRGSVVAIEPSTGRILAMYSNPSFDPHLTLESWDILRTDYESNPLLNRATQGLYPPGSVFKLVTAKAIMENIEDYENFYHECTGEFIYGEYRLRCHNLSGCGVVNLYSAMKYSCNTYFASTSLILGQDILIDVAERLHFNQNLGFDFASVDSRFLLDTNSSVSELIETSIGQGRTTATPLHMAMIMSAIANDGVLKTPFMFDYITTSRGNIRNQTTPRVMDILFTEEQSASLKTMMLEAVESGTGINARSNLAQISGKTGTAQVDSAESHGWFAAFSPFDNPQIAVVVITENTGNSRLATNIAKSVIEKYLN